MELAACHPSGTMKLDMAPTILENLYIAGKVGGYNTMKTEAEAFYHMLVTTYLRLHCIINKTTSDQTLPDMPM
jgi:hypothetical protein